MTDYTHLIGNEPIKQYLSRMVEKNAIANSLLFAGPSGVGKSLFANALALQSIGQGKIIQTPHPDIHHYQPEGKLGLHSIQSLRQLIDEVHLPPYESPKKVFIIHDADRMLSYSANALLKTFEEPPPQTIIILLSQAPSALLPTIRSRCRTVHFHAIGQQEIASFLKQRYSITEEVAACYASQAHGSIGRAIELFDRGGDPTRKLILDILSRGHLGLYRQLTDAVKSVAEQVDAIRKEAEDRARKEKEGFQSEYMSAVQQHAIEKELEGAVTVSFMNEARAIFDHLLSWYRDIHLLQLNGDDQFLMNADYRDLLVQAMRRGDVIPPEKVQKIIEEAILSLQRSTGFNICLENVFLKLNLI